MEKKKLYRLIRCRKFAKSWIKENHFWVKESNIFLLVLVKVLLRPVRIKICIYAHMNLFIKNGKAEFINLLLIP